MKFHEKLRALRKSSGLTQELLAEKLCVSRVAVSKWESGRGFPNLDSLKMMAQTFSVSIDYLLSSGDFQNDSFQNASSICSKQKINSLRKFFVPFGIMDVFAFLLFLLPVFANRHDGIKAVALPYLQTSFALTKILLVALVTVTAIFGIVQLAFRNIKNKKLITTCDLISLALSVLLVSLCAAGNYPYACVFCLLMFAIKTAVIAKRTGDLPNVTKSIANVNTSLLR